MDTLPWISYKTFLSTRFLRSTYIALEVGYLVWTTENGKTVQCVVAEASDISEFEASYKPSILNTLQTSQLDTDGATIVRNKAAKAGWTFCSLPMEFETSRLSDCMYAKDSAGINRTFITLKAYDGNNNEVTTPGELDANLATIEKTVIDFEPPYDFEIIGGDLRTLTAIAVDMRLWIIAVPDIPANMGGSKEMGGGINLRYLNPNNVWSVDGRVTKYATYNASLHTNKIRMILKYPPGANESLLMVVQLYKQ